MSRTMRIDLIPDIPAGKGSGRRNRVVVKSGTSHRDVSHVEAPPKKDTTDDLYHELLHGIYDAAIITDLKGIISDVNVRATEFLQWSAEELCGAFVADIISGAGQDLINMLVANLENERHSLIQAYCFRKDGSMFPAEIAVNKFRMGEGSLCFFVRDVTVRRQAEEMLRTEHNAIQNAANGIAIADLAANIEYANPALVKLLGYESAESLVGVGVREVLGAGELTEELIDKVLVHGATWKGEIPVMKPSGDKLDLGVFAACNRNSDGDTVGIVFSFADLSDRKRADDAIRKADRQRVMLESLGAACHHLGQPATVLSVSIGVIKSQLSSEDTLINELVDTSVKASERLGDVLRKLNEVNVYRTTSYLNADSDSRSTGRILDI